MRTYADTSFLVRLLTGDPGTAIAVADYRRLGRPALFFLPLHLLEVTNAIRQRAFHLRRTMPGGERAMIKRETEAALAVLSKFVARRIFVEAAVDAEEAIDLACALSAKHTERPGCRGFDLLHVAFALKLECEAFLTSDSIQGTLARAEGLKTIISTND